MVIVMIPTIPLNAIMMVVIAVHLMQMWSMVVGIRIVQVVNVLSLQQLLQQYLQLQQQLPRYLQLQQQLQQYLQLQQQLQQYLQLQQQLQQKLQQQLQQ